jgi:hypothetical protein
MLLQHTQNTLFTGHWSEMGCAAVGRQNKSWYSVVLCFCSPSPQKQSCVGVRELEGLRNIEVPESVAVVGDHAGSCHCYPKEIVRQVAAICLQTDKGCLGGSVQVVAGE